MFAIIIIILYGLLDAPSYTGPNAFLALLIDSLPDLIIALLAFSFVHFYYFRKTSELNSFREYGMKRLDVHFEPSKQGHVLRKAKKIKVLKTWFPDDDNIKAGIIDALTAGAEITLLLCEPKSDILAMRSKGAKHKKKHGQDAIDEFIKEISDNIETYKGSIDIRFYDEWPGVPIIWYDDSIYMGFYLRGKSSPFWPWVEVKKNSDLAHTLEKQFEELWVKSSDKTKIESINTRLEKLRK